MAPSFGGRRRVWGDGKMTFIQKKFTFYRQKFLMTFLNMVIDHVSRIFPLFALIFPDLYFVRYHTQPFPHKKNTFSHFASKIFLMTFFSHRPGFSNFHWFVKCRRWPFVHDPFLTGKHLFLLFSYFRAHPTTLLLKILGGTNAWAVPTSNVGGRPPSPP